MQKAVFASLLILVVNDNGLAQEWSRSGSGPSQTSGGTLQTSGGTSQTSGGPSQTSGGTPQERRHVDETLKSPWNQAGKQTTVNRRPQPGRTESNTNLMFPAPGANAPNTEHVVSDTDEYEENYQGPVGADNSTEINAALRQFALDLLTKLVTASPEANVVVSSFSLWTLLLAVLEGAQGDTADQIKRSLRLPLSRNKIRKNFKKLDSALKISGQSVVFESANALFSDVNRPARNEYINKLHATYSCDVMPVNFTNPREAALKVNNWVAKTTHHRITQLVDKDEIRSAELILANTVYFKGNWKLPFNSTATYRDHFYNERKEVIAEVQMMYQHGSYLYSFITEINAHVLDMSYADSKFRMLLILPKPHTTLRQVLLDMKRFPVDACYDRLVHEQEMYADDLVHVYIPRFKFKNKHELAPILQSMGIVDLFDETKANLTGINAQNGMYLGQVRHAAEIEVNEEGTIASGASGGMFINKAAPPKFIANRPFAFFIVEHSQRTVVFAGHVFNPNKPL